MQGKCYEPVRYLDDDNDFADSLADMVTSKGYNAEVVTGGIAAVYAWKSKRYDVTFIDIKMPGMNGIDTFFEIRKIDPQAKIILMTGYRRQEDLGKITDSDVIEILNKPLDLPYLLELLQKTTSDYSGSILIVDDDSDFTQSMTEILEKSGLSVILASTGTMALEIARQAKLSAMLVDLRLPDLHGFEVCETLHQLNKLPPTIVVTAYIDEAESHYAEFGDLGVSSYLYKPFAPESLFDEINRIITTHPVLEQ